MVKLQISDCCEINRASVKSGDCKDGLLYLDTSNITDNCIDNIHEYPSLESAPSRAQRRVADSTIIVSEVRPILRHIGILERPQRNLIVSTGFCTIDLKKEYIDVISPRYLYYLISQDCITQRLQQIAENSVSAYPSIRPSDIGNLVFDFPDINKQKTIVNLLESIDRKIALNRKENATLEAMAKQLYDYWFVQFDFPDTNGRPYKSSGGKMVWNATLKREIPAGWDDVIIGDLAEVYNGSTPSTSCELEYYGGNIVWITPKDLSDQQSKFIRRGARNISKAGFDSCSTTLLPKGSILMSSRAPIGLVSIADGNMCTNQGFKSFVEKIEGCNLYLYYFLTENMRRIEQLGTGTTFKEVSRDSILKFPILKVTDTQIFNEWLGLIKPVFERQSLLCAEIDELTRQRDFILPLLMSGQATIES